MNVHFLATSIKTGTRFDMHRARIKGALNINAISTNCNNLSSGSFLFSYKRLLEEGKVRRGDYAVLMTMGPGSTIETALIRW